LFSLCLLAPLFLLCTATLWAQSPKRDRLIIATDATYPPFEFKERGVLKGFDIDLGNALGKEMGVQIVWLPMKWDGVIPALDSGKVDLIMSGVTVNEERKRSHAFTRPYFLSGQAIARRKGNAHIAGIADLLAPGRTVAVQKLTTGQEAVEKQGMPADRIKRFSTLQDALLDVRNGRSDAVVGDLPALRDSIRRGFPELEIAPGKVIVKENVGIQARKTDLALVHALNEALDRLLVNGTYAEIYKRWILEAPQAELIAELVRVKDAGTQIPPHVVAAARGSGGKIAQEDGGAAPAVGSALSIRLDTFREVLPQLLLGAVVTLQLTALALLLGIPAGLLVALMRLSGFAPVRLVATWYVEVVRGTPLLMQVFVLYFVLGTPFNLPAFWAGVAALSLNAAAYISEIFRAGIESIEAGQMEAARALGMTYGQAMRQVILPQTLRRVLPPLTNEAVALLKDSSLVGMITVAELTLRGSELAPVTGSATTVYLAMALIYLGMTLPLTFLMRRLEARWQPISRPPRPRKRLLAPA
jgi:His/Glu/Gln/Arg/opine family amino acid ABC transporter permease subunit